MVDGATPSHASDVMKEHNASDAGKGAETPNT